MERWWATGDVIIVLAVVAVSVLLILRGIGGTGGSELRVKVTADGREAANIRLPSEKRYLTVTGYQGESRLEIEGNAVRMVDSACPDKLCVRTGWISRPGESIVCLPNRVVVEIVSGGGGPDVVNR